MLSYSTEIWSPATKINRWNEALSEVFVPLEQRPDDPAHFSAELSCVTLGEMRMVNAFSHPSSLVHVPKRACQSTERCFLLHMPVLGRLNISQDGKDALLDPGDLLLTDSALPYTLAFADTCRTLVMVVSPDEIKNRMPNPSSMLGVRLSGQQGLPSTTAAMLRNIWDHAASLALSPEIGTRLSSSLLDMFTASALFTTGAKVAESSVLVSRRIHIRRYIDANLRNPDLKVQSVAAAMKISPRYLYLLFSDEEETLCNYILRRRLDAVARQLADPQWRGHTITEIAFSWGFNNATHFSRVFKERFDQTPREYRKSRMAEVH